MKGVARLVAAGVMLLVSPGMSRADGPWQYVVTGPGGSSEIGPEQIGQVLYFELDATVPDYVWGNVRVDFDPALLECVSIEETPELDGFWTAWVAHAADPALGGGGVPYYYDDTGLGSEWASAWVATYGPGVAGPVASYDNAAGVIRFYTFTNAGGYGGSVPLRIGFRIKQAGVAVFTTAANDWTAFGWPGIAAVSSAAPLVAEADAAGEGYSWRLEDLPYRLTSQVTILPPALLVAIDVKPGSARDCRGDPAVIPVAILGAAGFDVTTVDVASISLEGMPVKVTGARERLLAEYRDVNGDGLPDLLVLIANTGSASGAATARLTATLHDGTTIEGFDSVCAPRP